MSRSVSRSRGAREHDRGKSAAVVGHTLRGPIGPSEGGQGCRRRGSRSNRDSGPQIWIRRHGRQRGRRQRQGKCPSIPPLYKSSIRNCTEPETLVTKRTRRRCSLEEYTQIDGREPSQRTKVGPDRFPSTFDFSFHRHRSVHNARREPGSGSRAGTRPRRQLQSKTEPIANNFYEPWYFRNFPGAKR